jgi:hypothetical protein
MVIFRKIGLTAAEISQLESFGLRYDKRQKRALMEDAAANQGVDETSLLAIEKKLGIEFPDDYRAFLLTNNGGRPSPSLVDVSPTRSVPLQLFLAVVSAIPSHTIAGVKGQYRDRMPSEFVPIARDGGGNLLVMDPAGEIYFWDHERESDSDPLQPYYANTTKIASSFTALVGALHD